jgi:hypothetical protein
MANLVCPNPSNTNFLSPNGFMLQIQKLPELFYFCQSTSLPAISLPAFRQSTTLSIAKISGETIEYDDLTVQFLIDENMANYNAIFDWIKGLGFPKNNDQYKNFLAEQNPNMSELAQSYSDGTLSVLDSSYNPVRSYNFVDLIPVSLTTIEFTNAASDVQYILGNATFSYSYYELMT